LGIMRLKGVLVLAVAACIYALFPPRAVNAVEAVVTDVRVGPQANATRVVFDLTNQLPFNIFTLSNPYRIVIDMPEVGWRLPARPLPSRVGVFETLRYGLYKPGNSRVVVDLRKPAIVKKAFIMAPSGTRPYRIVIDLIPASKATFQRHRKSPPISVAAVNSSKIARPVMSRTAVPVAKAPETPTVDVVRTAKQQTGVSPQQVVLNQKPAGAAATSSVPQSTSFSSVFKLAPRKPAFRPRNEKRLVVVDAGHGGPDPGTIGPSGIYEKHITLAMARELKKQMEATGRYEVVLTRERDVFIRLRERVQKSRDAGADLFISLHADSVKDRRISGPAVYTLSENASDKEAAALAYKENKSDLIAGIDLTNESLEVTNILIDLAQRESMNQSAIFAEHLVKEIKRDMKVLRNTHRFAGFAVLKAPDVPSVLLEMGFLSNPKDERNLRSRRYRQKFTNALRRGIDNYFSRVEEARSN